MSGCFLSKTLQVLSGVGVWVVVGGYEAFVFASERIGMLALRQFDVNCAGELDVPCNFAFQI